MTQSNSGENPPGASAAISSTGAAPYPVISPASVALTASGAAPAAAPVTQVAPVTPVAVAAPQAVAPAPVIAPNPAQPHAVPHRPGIIHAIFQGLFNWLSPVHTGMEGGQKVVVYTTFPKAFYLYLVWLPGFILMGLHSMGMQYSSASVWIMMAAIALTYLVIAEDVSVGGFVMIVTWTLAILALYLTHWLDWTRLPLLVAKLKNMHMNMDLETLRLFCTALFIIWLIIYLYSVTWRKRELSSLRRSKLRPPLGRKPLPISGLIVDLHPRDVLEMIFGFGAQDVLIETNDGKILDRDVNCVGLAFVSHNFNQLISELTVKEESPDVGPK